MKRNLCPALAYSTSLFPSVTVCSDVSLYSQRLNKLRSGFPFLPLGLLKDIHSAWLPLLRLHAAAAGKDKQIKNMEVIVHAEERIPNTFLTLRFYKDCFPCYFLFIQSTHIFITG